MRPLILLFILSLCSPLFGQYSSSAEVQTVLTGVEDRTPLGPFLIVPKNSKPVLAEVGVLSIEAPSTAKIFVDASDAKRYPVRVIDAEPIEKNGVLVQRKIIMGEGSVWISVVASWIDSTVSPPEPVIVNSSYILEIGVSPQPEPDPTPEPDPDPEPLPTPAPIPGPGFKVGIIYEYDEIPTIPSKQAEIIFAKKMRDYLRENTDDWRALDDDIELNDPVWSAVLKRQRASIPWIVISNGRTGYEGPLPATIDATIELIKRYK